MKRVLDSLLGSFDQALEQGSPKRFSSVFLGGGTPSAIPAKLMDDFLQSLLVRVGPVEEWSMEVNPESLNEEFLSMLSSSPVNRISMGAQSYDETLLSWLGRPSGRRILEHADALLASLWDGRLSRDVLASLPHQKKNGWLEDLDHALAGDPGHLSLYELTIEDDTPLAQDEVRLQSLPTEDEAWERWQESLEFLKNRGYQRYEVSNFARPGQECQHNLGYWALNPYLGLGPGAASTLPNEEGHPVRLEGERDWSRWVQNPWTHCTSTKIPPFAFALEILMMGMRCVQGVARKPFQNLFHQDVVDLLPQSLNKWATADALTVTEETLIPTESGLELVDAMLADMAMELEKKSLCWNGPWKHSSLS